MTKINHINTGACPKCDEIFSRFPNFHSGLKTWFQELQKLRPEAHISCAGRGRVDQEDAFRRGASKAHFGESAHSFNLALDIFKLHALGAEWPRGWFESWVEPAVAAQNSAGDFQLEWYGSPGRRFYELPHVEIKNWKVIVGKKPVE